MAMTILITTSGLNVSPQKKISAERNISTRSTQNATRIVAWKLAVIIRITTRHAAIERPMLVAVSCTKRKYCS